MNSKKLICAVCCFALALPCVACGTGTPPTDPNDPNFPDYSNGEIPDNNNVDVSEPDTTVHSFGLLTQNNGTLTYKCNHCNETETVVVSCESGTANGYTVNDNTITFCNISENSMYDINGSFHGNIVIDVGENYKFELQMSGFDLYAYSACPINIMSGDKITLSAKRSTENHIYDMRETADENSISASIYAQCDLDIQGKGKLDVKSVNNNGIHTKDDLNVKNLSLQVDCKDNALKGNDSVTIESGDIVLISRVGDGIKTSNSDVSSKGKQRGSVTISGGNVLIYSACNGIDSAYDTIINESSTTTDLQIFTDKYSKYSEEVTAVSENVYYVRYNSTAYSYSLKFYNDDSDAVWYNSSSSTTVGSYRYFPITKPNGYTYVQLFIYSGSQQQGQEQDYLSCTDGMVVNSNYDTIALQSRGNRLTYGWTNYTTTSQDNFGPGGPGGGFGGGPGGMNEGNPDKSNHSTKGIRADNRVVVSAGTVTISSYDDSIHARDDSALENGATPLGNINISGGNLALRSNDDAIHADGTVNISGGNLYVVNSHEGIEGETIDISGGNISVISSDDGINGTANSGTTITVSGGKLYVYAGGDGVDSNSKTSYAGIHFVGGTSVIISTGQSDSSIDTERGYNYTGGYVVAIGRSGGMGNEATNCSNFSSVGTKQNINLQKDAYLTVTDVATIKMPVSINALVVCLGKTNASISSSSSTSYTLDANGVYWNI